MKLVKNFIRDFDEIYQPSAERLHFRGDFLMKSYIGGLVSFGITLFVIYQFWIMNGYDMLMRNGPSLASLAESMDYEAVGQVSV